MRRTAGIVCRAAILVAIGFGVATGVGAVAYGEPPPDDSGGLTPGIPSIGYPDGEGGGGYKPTVPTFKPPESTVTGQTVVVRRPETPDVPPPVVIPVTPTYEPEPVDIPRVPVDVPVIVEPTVPVAVPVAVPTPPPVAVPVVPPPAAPPVPAVASPQVLLTSSAQPGTQALTVILMFTVVGAWIYGHRIVSHWTAGGRTDDPATA